MNKFIISGRLTADPEIKGTTDGKIIARFNFAVNRRFKREGEPDADFFNCVAFGKIAATFEKCAVSKGTKLLIEGEVRNNNYEKDGVMQYGNQVIVGSFEFCESKTTASGSAPSAPSEAPQPNTAPDFEITPDDEDLPF